MNTELLMDQIQVLVQSLQSQINQILVAKQTIFNKMDYLSMNMMQFKCDLLSNIIKICCWATKQANQTLKNKLNQHLVQEQYKLKKYRLHYILKKKINHQSSQSTNNHNLEQSMLLIQKDLNIVDEPSDLQNLGISNIIHKSMLSLEDSPIIPNDTMLSSNITIQGHKPQPQNESKNNKQTIVMKKNKKVVYSNKNTSKDTALGNLLQQSYNICLKDN